MANKKRCLRSDVVRRIREPRCEELSLESITEFINKTGCQEVFDYLDDEQQIGMVDKAYICNVIHTLVGATFKEWLKQEIEKMKIDDTTQKED